MQGIPNIPDMIHGKRKKARKGFKQSFITNQLIKQKGKCYYCPKKFYVKGIRPHKHHKDGNRSNNKSKNLVLTCVECHDRLTRKQELKRAKKQKSRQPRYIWEQTR